MKAPGSVSSTVWYRTWGSTGTILSRTTSGSTTTLTGLANGTEYEFYVESTHSGLRERGYTDLFSGIPTDGAPTYVTVSPGDAALVVTWTAGPADSHKVRHRVKDPVGDWEAAENTNSGYVITGLANGTEYEVQAGGVVGSETKWSATVSGTPASSSLVDPSPVGTSPSGVALRTGDETIEVTWTDGGPDADSHRVRYQKGTTGAWTTMANATGPLTITGLENDEEYGVQVGAVYGAVVRWAVAVNGTPAEGTSAPDNVKVAAGKALLQVGWTDALGADSHSVRYRVKATPANPWTDLTSQTSPITVTDLTNGSEYEVQVGAVYGGSPTWADVVSATPNGALPSAPTDLRLTEILSPTSAKLGWQQAENAEDFRVEYKPVSSATWSGKEGSSSNFAATIDGLIAGVEYQFRVRVQNGTGWSPWSDVVVGNLSRNPNPPDLTSGILRIDIAWSDVSEAPDSYAVQYRLVGDTEWTKVEDATSPHTLSVTLPDDKKHEQYDIRVGAVYGGSTYWSRSVAAIAYPPVAAVTELVVTPGDASLALNWTPAPHHNFQYVYVREVGRTDWPGAASMDFHNDGTANCNGFGSFIVTQALHVDESTLKDLINGTEYEVLVRSQFIGPGSPTADATIKSIPSDGAPVYVSASPRNTSLEVTWTDLSGVSSHSVRHRQKDPVGNWTTVTEKDSGYVITGLDNGTDYDVQVGGVVGSETKWSATVSGTPAAVVSILLTAEMEVGELTSRSVTWRGFESSWRRTFGKLAPRSFTHIGVNYQVTVLYRRVHNDDVVLETSPRLPSSTSDLTVTFKDKTYRVGTDLGPGRLLQWVGADKGLSLPATGQTVTVTFTADPAGPPSNVTVEGDDGSLQVSWTRGPSAESHTIRYREGTSGDWTGVHTADSPQTIADLTNGTAYQVQVGAVSGTITRWADVMTGTPSGDGRPGSLVLTRGDRQLEVTWSRVVGADSYQLDWRAGRSGTWTEVANATIPYTLTGLTNGNEYCVRVGVVSGGGSPSYSDPQCAIVRPALLGDLTMEVGERQIGSSMTWRGYYNEAGIEVGSLSSDTFTYGSTTYTIDYLFLNVQSDRVNLATTPHLSSGTSDLTLAFKDKSYTFGTNLVWDSGGWWRAMTRA